MTARIWRGDSEGPTARPCFVGKRMKREHFVKVVEETLEETLDSLPQKFRSTMYRTDRLFRVGGHCDVTSRFRRRLSRSVHAPCLSNSSSSRATRPRLCS